MKNVRPAAPDSRDRILDAALVIFAADGFDGATTRDIAARAEVNLGLIKYYFDSKLKLWQAAVDLAFGNLHDALAGLDDSAEDERGRAAALIRGYVRFVARHPEFVRLMHEEGKRSGTRMRWLVDRHVRPLYERLTARLRSAQKRGVLPARIDPVHFFYILIGAAGILFHQAAECRRLTGVNPMEDAVVEAHAEAVIAMFLGPKEVE
jgi:AcrR family transcriptional regulator